MKDEIRGVRENSAKLGKRFRFKKGVEYVGSFKEVDGVLVIDEDSWQEVEGGSIIDEDDMAENTLRRADCLRRGSLAEEPFSAEVIEAESRRLGFQHGWTFLGTPERTLLNARVAFVGLNPGGGGSNDDYDYGGHWDVPVGNGYFDESWGPNGTQTTIQKQLQTWHALIGVRPDESLCVQFVPFRSPDWDRLDQKAEAISFAERLWTWVLEVSPASLFVTMGKRPAEHLSKLLHAKQVAQFPTGWGSQTIDVWDAPDGRRIIGMPHPSRYALFDRANNSSETAETSLRAATAGAMS